MVAAVAPFSVFDESPEVPAAPISEADGRRIGLTRRELFQKVRGGFRRRKKPPLLNWLQRNVRFPPHWESKSFNLKKGPHVRGVFERFWLNPKFRKANLPWAVRSMKTTTLIELIEYTAVNDPVPMVILFPDQKMLDTGLSEHVYPMLEQCPPIRRQLVPRSKRNRNAIIFDECRVRLANAGTVSDSSGYPAKYVFKFEHDKCPTWTSSEADSSQRIESRTVGYPRGVKIIEEGSPGKKSVSRAARMLADPDIVQFRYQVPCPHCGVSQKLTWDQFRVPKTKSGKLHAGVAAKGAHYECCHCKKKIEDEHRNKMMQAGQWVGQGEWVDPCTGELCGELSVDSDTCVFGEYSILYSLLIDGWGEIARRYVDAVKAQQIGDTESMFRFVTEYLAQPYEDAPPVTDVSELAEFLKGDHKRGTCPDETAFLTTTVDVGSIGNGTLVFQWQVTAWWKGAQGAVVDWGMCVGVDKFLQWVADTKYPLASRADVLLPVSEFPIAIDSGKYSSEVYAVVDMVQGAFAIKGDSRTGQNVSVDLYYGGNRRSDQDAKVAAMKRKLGIYDLVMINSEATQQYRLALTSMRLKRGWFGFVRMPRDVCDSWLMNEAYFDQLQADYKDGNKWKRSGANEAGDHLRYARAVAQRYTLNGDTWETVALSEKYLNLPPRPPVVSPQQRGALAGSYLNHSYFNRSSTGENFLISQRG